MQRSLEEIEFTVFDTETTGLEASSGDRIVELAAIRFKGREKISTFQSLVNPKRMISAGAFAVNKISQEILVGAPTIETVLPKFLTFIQDSCLCSYNVGFDLGFLNNELKLTGKNALEGFMVVDILRMARRILPNLERHSLWFVAQSLGIKSEQQHRAFSDVQLTLEVFYRLKEMLRVKGILDFTNFLSLFGLNSQLLEDINNQKLARIQEAIDLGVKLKLKYLSSGEAEVTEREVIPREIKQEKKRNYLVGHCCLRNDERTFRIDGILHLEII